MAPDREMLDLVKAILTIDRHRILLATTVAEAMTRAGQEHPDLIVAADGGHDMGLRLCQSVRQDAGLARTPFVLMTTSDRQTYPRYFAEGCDQILPIPFKCAELHAAIDKAHRGNQDTAAGRIHILRTSGEGAFVDPATLNRLLAQRDILCFRRRSGLAVVGQDPMRCGRRADYPGPERRSDLL